MEPLTSEPSTPNQNDKGRPHYDIHNNGKTKFLIVDDDYDIALTLKAGLDKSGYEVDLFSEPKKLVREFMPGIYSLMLVDVRMPGMTGFELFEILRKQDDRFRICFITAFEQYYNSLSEFSEIGCKLFFEQAAFY
jgi:DNA-binding NtrC family response regulator